MNIKILSINNLTTTCVSITSQKYTTIDGTEYKIGKENTKSYLNSIKGREELKTEIVEPQLNAIIAIWGENPTIEEKSEVSA